MLEVVVRLPVILFDAEDDELIEEGGIEADCKAREEIVYVYLKVPCVLDQRQHVQELLFDGDVLSFLFDLADRWQPQEEEGRRGYVRHIYSQGSSESGSR